MNDGLLTDYIARLTIFMESGFYDAAFVRVAAHNEQEARMFLRQYLGRAGIVEADIEGVDRGRLEDFVPGRLTHQDQSHSGAPE